MPGVLADVMHPQSLFEFLMNNKNPILVVPILESYFIQSERGESVDVEKHPVIRFQSRVFQQWLLHVISRQQNVGGVGAGANILAPPTILHFDTFHHSYFTFTESQSL